MDGARSTRSRKRQKVSHADDDISDQPSISTMTANKPAEAQPTEMASAQSIGKELGVLEEDLESMRQLISCKICQRFLTEPYGLACGHAYCYICLDSWLVTQGKNTCPECRAVVQQQPVPSLIIREMVKVFSTKAELLPDGESIMELEMHASEAALKVANDKADTNSGGLFRGMFSLSGRRREALYDSEDNVHRCPMCFHEIEDGTCSGCGMPIEAADAWPDHDGAEFDPFEEIGTPETEAWLIATHVRDRLPQGASRRGTRRPNPMVSSDDDIETSTDTDEPDLEGFVVPDDDDDDDDEDRSIDSGDCGLSEAESELSPGTQNRILDELDARREESIRQRAEERSQRTEPHAQSQSLPPDRLHLRRRARAVVASSAAYGAAAHARARRNNASRPIVLSDSEEPSTAHQSDEGTADTALSRRRRVQRDATNRGRAAAPQSVSSTTDSTSQSSSSDDDEDDEDEPPIHRARKTRIAGLRTRDRARVPSAQSGPETTSNDDSSSCEEGCECRDDENDDTTSTDTSHDDSDSDTDSSGSTATAGHGVSTRSFDTDQHDAVLAATLRLHSQTSQTTTDDDSSDY